MVDIQELQDVEILVDDTGKLWVNAEGRCILRVGHARLVVMDDPRRGQDVVYEEESDD